MPVDAPRESMIAASTLNTSSEAEQKAGRTTTEQDIKHCIKRGQLAANPAREERCATPRLRKLAINVTQAPAEIA